MRRRKREPDEGEWPPELLDFHGVMDVEDWNRRRREWDAEHPDSRLPELVRRAFMVEEL